MAMKTEKFTITIPIDVREKLKEIAEAEGRSVSNLASVLIKQGIERKTA
jgi:predicted CopG family antitoxin